MGLIADFITGDLARKRAYNKHVTTLYEGGRRSRNRKSASGQFSSPEGTTNTAERLQMIREARELEDDFPLANMILNAFDIYALGSIRYQPMTGNLKLNREISDWLKYWFSVCDFQGRVDFDTIMRITLRGKKRDGEAGLIHVEDGGDYRLQMISGDRIGNPTFASIQSELDQNGIILDEYGRVKGYEIYRKLKNMGLYQFDKYIPSSWFSHVCDIHRPDAYHGVTAFKSVITRMRDLKETMDYSRINIKYRSTQLPYFKTESGELQSSVPNYQDEVPTPTVDKDGVTLEQVDGGEQNFFKITEGIFEFPNDFPNQQFLPMVETEVKEIMAGVGLSYDFHWKIDKLTGTVGRLVVEREDRVMQNERRNMERQCMRTIITRAIESGIRNGAISKPNAKKFEGEFFYGARISADYGRDNKIDIDLVNAGLLTEEEYYHTHGRDPDKVRSVRIAETIGVLDDAKMIADRYEIDIENAANMIRQEYANPPKSQNKTESIVENTDDVSKT